MAEKPRTRERSEISANSKEANPVVPFENAEREANQSNPRGLKPCVPPESVAAGDEKCMNSTNENLSPQPGRLLLRRLSAMVVSLEKSVQAADGNSMSTARNAVLAVYPKLGVKLTNEKAEAERAAKVYTLASDVVALVYGKKRRSKAVIEPAMAEFIEIITPSLLFNQGASNATVPIISKIERRMVKIARGLWPEQMKWWAGMRGFSDRSFAKIMAHIDPENYDKFQCVKRMGLSPRDSYNGIRPPDCRRITFNLIGWHIKQKENPTAIRLHYDAVRRKIYWAREALAEQPRNAHGTQISARLSSFKFAMKASESLMIQALWEKFRNGDGDAFIEREVAAAIKSAEGLPEIPSADEDEA